MFDSIGWYSQLLLLFFLSILFFVLVVVFRRYWNTPPSRLRVLLTRPGEKLPDSALESLVPLLLLEERHRCFTDILGIVLSRYPLRRFTRRKNFAEALNFLRQAAYRSPASSGMDSAMCEIVRCFLEDPDVEYSCRAEFRGLVDRFLFEVEESRRGSENAPGSGREPLSR